MPELITTLGPKRQAELGTILPHEHIFVDLRNWDTPGYAQADADEVIQLMAPEIIKAQKVVSVRSWNAVRSAWDAGRI